jgi:DNA-binding transcriptional MerR regulator
MSQSITEKAWTLYRAAEVKAGRKFTTADRKGKNSEWAKAMRQAYDDVMRERRISAVQHLLKQVPEYSYWSLDPEKNSEGRRRQYNEVVDHNMRIIAKASERPLNQKQAAEAKALGLSVKEYRNAAKWAKENGMSVTAWEDKIKAEDAVRKKEERQKMDEHPAWLPSENKKKVAAMRGRYTRRGYARSW